MIIVNYKNLLTTINHYIIFKIIKITKFGIYYCEINIIIEKKNYDAVMVIESRYG